MTFIFDEPAVLYDEKKIVPASLIVAFPCHYKCLMFCPIHFRKRRSAIFVVV
jgi:hypothetical protein